MTEIHLSFSLFFVVNLKILFLIPLLQTMHFCCNSNTMDVIGISFSALKAKHDIWKI